MTRNTLIRAFGATLFLALGANSVSAGEIKTLSDWKQEAGEIVSYKMDYPRTTTRRRLPESYNIVEIEMARDGRVLSTELAGQSESPLFDRASRHFADNLESLPPLPDSYQGETASVRIYLLYADDVPSLQKIARGIVKTRQLAGHKPEAQTAAIDLMVSGGR